MFFLFGLFMIKLPDKAAATADSWPFAGVFHKRAHYIAGV